MAAGAGRRRAIALVGATATGKTAVGEKLAEAIGGDVVCADARQLYRELERGTGKPTPAERAARPHHLFDLLALGESASAGRWARAAAEVCEQAFASARTPVLVGGSGLYLRALQQGLHPEPARDEQLRARLGSECEQEGVEAMHARLTSLDPETAAKLRPRDRQRVLRALEVVIASGQPLAHARSRPLAPPLQAEWRTFELVATPAWLARRIHERTQEMWESGLVREVEDIVAAGGETALQKLAAIGYDEALEVTHGRLSEPDALERMELRTRQLAKRQRTWFRHQVQAQPLEIGEALDVDALVERVLRALAR